MANVIIRDIYFFQRNTYNINVDTEVEKLREENDILKSKLEKLKEKSNLNEPVEESETVLK